MATDDTVVIPEGIDDAALFKAAQVVHLTYDDLSETSEAVASFGARTLQMAEANDEEWR